MSVYRISYRYANSFFQLAVELNSLKSFAQDAELISSTIDKSKELKALLKNPIVKTSDKKILMEKIFEKKIEVQTLDFIKFVIDKNREDILQEIMLEFLNLRDIKEGILRAKVTSANELTDKIKKDINSKLETRTGKKVYSQYLVNDNLIGGFIVKVEDTVIDASVSRQLELLRKKLKEDISISNN